MAKVVLNPGEKLEIEFAETDGSFEVHFDSAEHPNALVVKETAGLSGSECGDALEILYEEKFNVPITGDIEEERNVVEDKPEHYALKQFDPITSTKPKD